jgi:hypothetical protein
MSSDMGQLTHISEEVPFEVVSVCPLRNKGWPGIGVVVGRPSLAGGTVDPAPQRWKQRNDGEEAEGSQVEHNGADMDENDLVPAWLWTDPVSAL